MRTPSFRVTDDFYEKMNAAARQQNISLSDLIRSAVEQAIENLEQTSDPVDPVTISVLQAELEKKNEQIEQLHQLITAEKDNVSVIQAELSTKNAQIDQLHQLVAMAQSNQADTLKQLEDAKAQGKRRWWKFGR